MAIDYGRFPMKDGSLPNRNQETGIRYGIVSSHEVNPDWLDEFEPEYSHSCGRCGVELADDFEEPAPCPHCGENLNNSEDCWSEEPTGFYYDEGVIVASLDEHNDIWIFSSPVVGWGSHCSPCAPGAVSLHRKGGAVRCYGLPDELWRD